MRLNVNPTRMELTNLKKRHKVAVRGHKLLKDKQDELMKKFIELIKKNDSIRKEVEKEFTQSLNQFMIAKAVMGSEFLLESIMVPSEHISLNVSSENIMSVNVPIMEFDIKGNLEVPYGYAQTSGELDDAIDSLYKVLPRLLELAEIEKSCQLMADEIEKTRRRVNALEYFMIPQLEETIKYITMKLEENERANLTRLMKVKSMMEESDKTL